MALVLEVQSVRNLLQALVVVIQHELSGAYDVLVDELAGRTARKLLAHGGEIFGGDAQAGSVVVDAPQAMPRLVEQLHETLQEGLGGGILLHGWRRAPRLGADVEHLVNHGSEKHL